MRLLTRSGRLSPDAGYVKPEHLDLLRARVKLIDTVHDDKMTPNVGGGEIGGQFRRTRGPLAQDVSTGSSSLLRLWDHPKRWRNLAAKVA